MPVPPAVIGTKYSHWHPMLFCGQLGQPACSWCWSLPDPVPPLYSNTMAESGGILWVPAHKEHYFCLCDAGWFYTKRFEFIALW